MEIRTPILKDKRFLLVAGSIVGVLALVALGRTPSDAVLTYMAGVVTAYVVQSQYGQTKRAVGATQAQP